MPTKCPKCGYERKSTDSAPEWQCPSCGVAYAKVSASSSKRSADVGAISKSNQAAQTQEATPKGANPVSLVIVGFACLAIGYFAGREHIKYELRQTITTAAEEMQKGLSAAFGVDSTPPPEPPTQRKFEPKKERQSPFSVQLLRKGFMESNFQAGIPEDAIIFSVAFQNKTGKDIRAFDGRLTFMDLLDNTILGAKLAINDPVSAGSTMEWDGQLDFNQFIDRHQRLRSADQQNLKIAFEVKKILFTDGTVEEF